MDTVIQQPVPSVKDIQKTYASPNHDFSEVAHFVTKIYNELGHSHYHDKELIAKLFGLSYSSIKGRLSSAQEYNLLEIKYGVGYKITPLFISFHKPIDENERRNAIVDALNHPELYSKLFQQYNGNVIPQPSLLSTILFRQYNINEKVAGEAADLFLKNLKDFGLINEHNVLNLNVKQDVSPDNNEIEVYDDENENESIVGGEQKKLLPPVNAEIVNIEMLEIPIPLKSGKRAFLKIPENYQPEDLERIGKFVDALK